VSYVERILGEGEQIAYRTSLHWVIYFRPLLVLLAGLLVWAVLREAGAPQSGWLWVLLLPGAWLIGMAYLRQRLEEYVVTTQRVIARWGILRRDVYVHLLKNIQNIDVHQSILGRALGYGTVAIHTAGTQSSTTSRDYIRDPEGWRGAIVQAIDRYRGERQATGTVETAGVGESAEDRLRVLKALLDQGFITPEQYAARQEEVLREI
jgi:membrane protein YdbS with pleckstrin-like domain